MGVAFTMCHVRTTVEVIGMTTPTSQNIKYYPQ